MVLCMVESITNVFPSGSTDQCFDANVDIDIIKHIVVLRKIVE